MGGKAEISLPKAEIETLGKINLKKAVLVSLVFFGFLLLLNKVLLDAEFDFVFLIYNAVISGLVGLNFSVSTVSGGGSAFAGVLAGIVSSAGCAGCLLPIFASILGASAGSTVAQGLVSFKIPLMIGTVLLLSGTFLWNLKRSSKKACCDFEEEGGKVFKNFAFSGEGVGSGGGEKKDQAEKMKENQRTKVKVELLYWDECPNWRKALDTLQKVLKEIEDEKGLSFSLELVKVDTDELAKKLAFPGSPTVRVEGVDVWETDSADVQGLTCRVYRVEGKLMPFLPEKILKESVLEILRKEGRL